MNDTATDSATPLDMRRVVPIFLLVFVDMLGLTVILPLLHLYAVAFGATPLQIGMVVAAFPLAQLIGVPLMGALSDRYGRKPLLLISQVTTCLSFIMLGLATSLEFVILSRLLDGLFGANISTAQAALSDITDESNRTRGLGITGAAFGLGFIFGPLLAVLALEISDSLALPAFTAAIYSFVSILITALVFKETHPQSERGPSRGPWFSPAPITRFFLQPALGILLLLMFAQQLIFFGYESLLGTFTLTRLGFLGRGNAALFLLIGIILVTVQLRFIGRWRAKLGDRGLVILAFALLALGLLLTAQVPETPHPFYVRELVQRDLLGEQVSATEALIGELGIDLPPNGNNGLGGVFWMVIAVVPLSIGAGLIRPALNSLITQRVTRQAFGSALGVSAALVSAANATAPLFAGLIFQHHGATTPFLLGGLLMAGLCVSSLIVPQLVSRQP